MARGTGDGFPEMAAPGHWGGYDALAGASFGADRWLPVREAITYLVGYALADTANGCNLHLDVAGESHLAETASGVLYRLQSAHGSDQIRGSELALLLGAAEDCHFHGNPNEGVRFGCPTCEALVAVHEAMGLPPTQWLTEGILECHRHETCSGCPREHTECDEKESDA